MERRRNTIAAVLMVAAAILIAAGVAMEQNEQERNTENSIRSSPDVVF